MIKDCLQSTVTNEKSELLLIYSTERDLLEELNLSKLVAAWASLSYESTEMQFITHFVSDFETKYGRHYFHLHL